MLNTCLVIRGIKEKKQREGGRERELSQIMLGKQALGMYNNCTNCGSNFVPFVQFVGTY